MFFPSTPFYPLLFLFLSLSPLTQAQIFTPSLKNCHTSSSTENTSSLITFSSAYAQIVPNGEAAELGLVESDQGRRVIRVDLLGETGEEIIGFDNVTGKLATMFTDTTDLTYKVYSTTSYLCNSLFPTFPLPSPYIPSNTSYCPFPAGPLGINISIPIDGSYALTTLTTTIRIVDTALPANELACVMLTLTPYYPTQWYYMLFLWLPAALAIGFWVSSWASRFAAGWVVGRMMDHPEGEGLTAAGEIEGWGKNGGKSRKWGTMLISGLSGERLGVSGGLLRFITPGFRDVLWHLQFCAVLGMMAVRWPDFAYPILTQSSWASLVWNATIVQGNQLDSNSFPHTLTLPPTTFPTDFAGEMNDTLYPLYMDTSLDNHFLALNNDSDGMEKFAAVVGLRPQDMYNTCIVLFLCVVSGIVTISLIIWLIHGLVIYLLSSSSETGTSPLATTTHTRDQSREELFSRTKSNGVEMKPRDSIGSTSGKLSGEGIPPETPTNLLPALSQSQSRGLEGMNMRGIGGKKGQSKWKRAWWRFKIKGPIGAYHWNALCGNLVRVLLLFHLPITLFSVYQWTIKSQASKASLIFSALTFAIISIILPIYLVVRIFSIPTAKLYDATRTLLSLGPVYNTYKPGSQHYQVLRFAVSLATGIVIGAGQKSGTAQAIVLLVIEITFGVVTTFWKPWRPGSGMAIPQLLFSLLRIVSAVLLMLMSPAINLPSNVVGWIAYIVIGLQGLAFLYFTVMLICKILEGLIRLFGNVRFEDSTHPLDGGLFAAFGGLRKRRKKSGGKTQKNGKKPASAGGSINTQMMLDRHSSHTLIMPSDGRANPFASQANLHLPPQRPGMGGYAPVNVYPGHRMTDSQSYQDTLYDPSLGFAPSQSPSARIAYQDPYAPIPTHSRTSSSTGIPLRTSVAGGSTQGLLPYEYDSSGRPSHGRNKSQTTILQANHASQGGSSSSVPLWGGNANSGYPLQQLHSQQQGLSTGMSRPRPNLQPIAVPHLSVNTRGQPPSPASRYSSEEEDITEQKSNKRSTWFGKGKKKGEADQDGSSEEDSIEEFGVSVGKGNKGKSGTEPARTTKWLAGIRSKNTSLVNLNDQKRQDENANRKSGGLSLDQGLATETTSSSSQLPPVRSFGVTRAPRSTHSGGNQSVNPSPSSSIPPSPVTPLSLPLRPTSPPTSDQAQEPPRKSFVVNRAPQRMGRGNAGNSPVTSPETGMSPSQSPNHTTVPLPSFVVSRSGGVGSRSTDPTRPVGFQPLSRVDS